MLDVIYLLAERWFTLDRSPGLAAQIVDRIVIQHRLGVRAAVVAVAVDPDHFESSIGSTLCRLDVPYRLVPAVPAAVRMIKASRLLRSVHRNEPARNVCVRDPWSSFVHQLAFPISGPDLVYDMRGDVIAESEHRGRSRLKRTILGQVNKHGIKHASKYLAVSSQAAELLTNQFGGNSVDIVPSYVDYERFQASADRRSSVRAEFGVREGDTLVVYAGGVQAYQMIPETLKIRSNMATDPTVKFLLLTHEDGTESPPPRIPKGQFFHRQADRSDIPAYLAASDIGFLLRTSHQLNHVASPIKFGEYLASGLSVVSTLGIGDVSGAIKQNNLGCIVQLDDVTGASETALELVRSLKDPTTRSEAALRSRKFARERYDWAAYAKLWNPGSVPATV